VIRYAAFTKRFGRHPAVADLSLEVGPGEIVALLGPNGSGKTTTLKAAAGLLSPTSGEVLVGAPALPASDPAARRVLSFLPQKVSFPDALTGGEVVDFYRRLRDEPASRGAEVLRMAALNGAAGRAVGGYSGGMVQRLGLAVAALPDVPVLLLDEPTSSLDAEGLAAFHALAEERRRGGRSVLFTSHQLADVERLADRVAVLVDGRLVAQLSRAALTDRLAARGLLRIRLAAAPPALLARVAAVAPGAQLAGEELVVPGPPRVRAAAVEAVRAAGVEIRGLTAEEGRLDLLYRELAGSPP
jgi:Cu-processing system ATP-binding protein